MNAADTNIAVIGWDGTDRYGQDGVWFEAATVEAADAMMEKNLSDAFGEEWTEYELEYTYISDISEMSDGAWYHFQSQWELSRKNGWVSEAVDALVLAEKKRREDDEDEDEE